MEAVSKIHLHVKFRYYFKLGYSGVAPLKGGTQV